MNILPGCGTTDLAAAKTTQRPGRLPRGGLTISQTAIHPDTAPEEDGAAVQAINRQDARHLD